MTDTAAKRRSAAGLYPLFCITPDATQPQAWRQDAGWGYYGILVDEPTVPPEPAPPGGCITTSMGASSCITTQQFVAGCVNASIAVNATTYRETTDGDIRITTSGEERILQ